MDDTAGVPGNEEVGGDLDKLLGEGQLLLGTVQLELGLEHPERVWLFVVWIFRLGLQHVAVGVAPGTQIDQVVDGLVEQLVDQLVVVGQGVDGEGHQRVMGTL